jgi:DUF305 family protein family protein
MISRSLFRPATERALPLALALFAMSVPIAVARAPSAPTMRPFGCAAPASSLYAEAPFLAENSAAMRKMMKGMAARPTGDVDRDFVEMMVPHHQGAVDMADAFLRAGHNEKLRRLAQEIVVTQQQEIAVMKLAINEPLPPSKASPTQVAGEQPRVDCHKPSTAAMPANMKMQ